MTVEPTEAIEQARKSWARILNMDGGQPQAIAAGLWASMYADTLLATIASAPQEPDDALLNDIAMMMSEFVDNWPQPKKVKTALALIAKALRIALNPGDEQIKHMTERFLSWKLPENFNPDNGISAKRPNYGPGVTWEPMGTNLFDYTQAEAMVRHMLTPPSRQST